MVAVNKDMKTNKVSLKKQIKYLQSLISMKCLDCMCYQPKEIISCESNTCPLWQIRPKKKKGLYILAKKLKQINLSISESKN